jgi:putative MATE family efflux protein
VHLGGLYCKGQGRRVQDLTKGSISRHLISMAAFIGMGMVFQTLYLLVDLYFVSHIGKQAIAGVSAAGTTYFLVLGTTQLVAVGALSLIAQATGRKDAAEADLVFNQAMSFAMVSAGLVLVFGYLLTGPMMRGFAADAETAEQGRLYLAAFLPALAAFFPGAAMNSGLRATGVVRPTMIVQTLSVLLNIALAPVLVAGWGTGRPLGVLGAGLASSIATVVSLGVLTLVFGRVQHFLRIRPSTWAPRLGVWRRIVMIGLPSAGEFVLMSVITAIVYVVIRGYGPAAQAGFGIGGRVMQSIFLPAMAVSFAVAPIAGQNYGAKRFDRVRETFRQAAIIGAVIMLSLTALCAISPPGADDPIHPRPGGDRGGGGLSQDRHPELRGLWPRVLLFGPVPGAGRHASVLGLEREPPSDLCAPGAVGRPARRGPARDLLVPVGRLGHAAGGVQRPAAPARVSPQAQGACGARGRSRASDRRRLRRAAEPYLVASRAGRCGRAAPGR